MHWGAKMKQDVLSYDNINHELLEDFPHLRPEFSSKIGEFPGYNPGPYVVFGSVFNSYIEECYREPQKAREMTRFIERMALSPDPRVEDLLKIEIIPTLVRSQLILDTLWPVWDRKLGACWPSGRRRQDRNFGFPIKAGSIKGERGWPTQRVFVDWWFSRSAELRSSCRDTFSYSRVSLATQRV
jgi:hypothetical protein